MSGTPAQPATGKQLTKIVLQLQDLGVRERARRLAVVSALSGRRVTTMRQLTADRAGLLITELGHILESADPGAELAAAAARAGGDS